ncbi:MAG: alkaline phosphatase [Eubacteriales bacterium]
MKKVVLIFLAIIFVFAGCSQEPAPDNQINELSAVPTAEAITSAPTEQIATPSPTAEPTATPLPEKPKYIFIVIGDGMGQGAASLGEIYARLEAEDMSVGAQWESFDVKRMVGAMGDSSSGGTSLATGAKSRQGYISLDINANSLYTIMDRAKANGLDTGVVSNSSLADATPAVFLSNTDSRYEYGGIIAQIPTSNVDYMAGGGMRFFGSSSQADILPAEDCYGIEAYYKGKDDIMDQLGECGYSLYYGRQGAVQMLEALQNGEVSHEKAIYALSLVYMPWEIEKYKADSMQSFADVPNLVEMTEMGIRNLSQNPDGFVLMVEEAFIDKAAHMGSTIRQVYQVKLLNDTLKVIMEFYNQHPYETLVVLTADHETGKYLYNQELIDQFKTLPDFRWSDDGDELSEFLIDQWDFHSYESYYYNQIKNANSDVWENEGDSRVQALAEITATTARKYGTIITTKAHSFLDVPLYVVGNGSDEFAECTHISEVPQAICRIMGWDALPEIETE